jgi:hypothetical protein
MQQSMCSMLQSFSSMQLAVHSIDKRVGAEPAGSFGVPEVSSS